ncbi:MAG: threonine dehydratase [Solirubrobacteraceae bacterium]|jgi:hypothetical protein|nr:threonine dehydratase [Solirubrobacteraceae bacterium]
MVAAVAQRERATQMICASAGNLGQALAYSGAAPGPGGHRGAARSANPLKVRQIAALGATVQLEGEDIEDARMLAREIAQAHGAYLVEDSLHLATCEGAATIGLELVRDNPKLEVVLVALGGGAMASGVGYVLRSLADHVEVIGIQPVGAPAMALSWRQGTVLETDRIDTIADGVAGRCPIPEVLDDLLVVLHDVVLVSEDSISGARRRRRRGTSRAVRRTAHHHDPLRKQRSRGRLRAVGKTGHARCALALIIRLCPSSRTAQAARALAGTRKGQRGRVSAASRKRGAATCRMRGVNRCRLHGIGQVWGRPSGRVHGADVPPTKHLAVKPAPPFHRLRRVRMSRRVAKHAGSSVIAWCRG